MLPRLQPATTVRRTPFADLRRGAVTASAAGLADAHRVSAKASVRGPDPSPPPRATAGHCTPFAALRSAAYTAGRWPGGRTSRPGPVAIPFHSISSILCLSQISFQRRWLHTSCTQQAGPCWSWTDGERVGASRRTAMCARSHVRKSNGDMERGDSPASMYAMVRSPVPAPPLLMPTSSTSSQSSKA